ncbi:pyroglutamylated RF-amide peptide receptor [Polypterus senegalus]
MNITPEVLELLLQKYNLSRDQFITMFQLQPLVFVPRLPTILQPIFGILYMAIFSVALGGNIAVLLLLCRKKALKSTSTFFVCSLALSDLLISLVCIPITFLQHFSTNWLAGGFLCKLVPFLQVTAVSTSILTMTCIAAERFQGILYPLQLGNIYSPIRATKMLAGVWLSSLAIASPMWYAHKVEIKYDFLFDVHYTCCLEVWPLPWHRQVYTTVLLVLMFLVPMGTMGILYGKIIHELWCKHRIHDVMFQALPGSEINKITRKRKRAVKMMVVVVLLFVICWLPFHLVSVLSDFGHLHMNEEQEFLLYAAVQVIGFSNSVCNPVVYAALNENFKKHLLCLLMQGIVCRRGHCFGSRGVRVGISTVESQHLGEPTEQSLLGMGRHTSRIAWELEPHASSSFPQVHLFRAVNKQHSDPLLLSVTDPLMPPTHES